MKRYTGKLSKSILDLIKTRKGQLQKLLSPKGLGKTANNSVYTLNESLAKHNPNLSKEEIQAWVWYRRKQGVPMTNWKEYFTNPTEKELNNWVYKGYLFVENGKLVPYAIFTFGNLYEKISKVKQDETLISEKYGTSVYLNHLAVLEKLKPKPISILNPVEAERPVILAISVTADTFIVSSLKEIALSEPSSLKSAYIDWLRAQSDEMFNGTSAFQIINYYLGNEKKPRSYDEAEWSKIKKNSRDEGERLFKLFLHTALEYTDQVRIDAEYNSKFNAVAPLQYDRIPVALETSKKFKGFDLQITPSQAEGVAFIELVGSGIIAYDVGVGKTMTAIINVVNAINSGRCKRPLIVVPNPTYKNWIFEMFGNGSQEGILTGTGITFNDWYNLGSGYDHIDLSKKVAEKSITVVTYEGLEKIGFSESTSNEHFLELSNILSQRSDATAREVEKENEKLREVIGVGLKETICDIETIGIDFIVVDEAHNFKNVFSEVKSDDKNGKQFHIKGGQPSNRAIKLFFLANYIQRQYGRNVILLTATPFTNSPLEIYSMLSFVAYDYMKSWGIYNLRTFFEQYISETTEYVVGIDGEIQQRNVVKSFNNRISLQKLINSHISFKTGEEANVPRPCKLNIPKTSMVTDQGIKKLKTEEQILSYLKLTPRQEANQKLINMEASKGADRDDPGRLLRLMSQSLNNALSPFLYESEEKPDYYEFVEESPKIKYAIECIKSVKEWHEKRNEPVSGQVMYIDRGRDFFPLIKEYLETELGYKKGVSTKYNPKLKVDEVEVISSGISQAQKEKVKQAFNEGTCKIIIGTSTIKEGINLQSKSTVLYNLYPNWNPTDIRQLEGRIWRQGNMFGYVRVVMPLMENSMDVFVFQKLEEKTSRINDLWSKADRGNVLDEESLDPNEVKFALVTDLGVLQRFELKKIKEEVSQKVQILTNRIKDLGEYVYLNQQVENQRQTILKKLFEWESGFMSLDVLNEKDVWYSYAEIAKMQDEKIQQFTKDKQYTISRYKKLYELLQQIKHESYLDKDLIQAAANYMRLVLEYSYDNSLERFKENASKLAKIKRTVFEQRGYSETADINQIKMDFEKELMLVELEKEEINSPEFQEKVLNQIIEQKQKYEIKGGTLNERVKDFASLNYLMSWHYQFIDKDNCEIPTKEYQGKTVQLITNERERKLKLAKAKAKAIKLKLKLKTAA